MFFKFDAHLLGGHLPRPLGDHSALVAVRKDALSVVAGPYARGFQRREPVKRSLEAWCRAYETATTEQAKTDMVMMYAMSWPIFNLRAVEMLKDLLHCNRLVDAYKFKICVGTVICLSNPCHVTSMSQRVDTSGSWALGPRFRADLL